MASSFQNTINVPFYLKCSSRPLTAPLMHACAHACRPESVTRALRGAHRTYSRHCRENAAVTKCLLCFYQRRSISRIFADRDFKFSEDTQRRRGRWIGSIISDRPRPCAFEYSTLISSNDFLPACFFFASVLFFVSKKLRRFGESFMHAARQYRSISRRRRWDRRRADIKMCCGLDCCSVQGCPIVIVYLSGFLSDYVRYVSLLTLSLTSCVM